MGNFYTNYTLRGPSQQAVARALTGRSAIVSTEVNGCVVVFDEVSDGQDQEIIAQLGSTLSSEFDCPVLAVLNHDDDMLWYHLYKGGKLVDEYDSMPDDYDPDTYYDDDETFSPPAGGDAQKLCAAFGSNNVKAVETVLRKSAFDENDGYTFEVERHSELTKLLGIPSFCAGCGYRYIMDGELPHGLTENDLIWVE